MIDPVFAPSTSLSTDGKDIIAIKLLRSVGAGFYIDKGFARCEASLGY